MDKKTLQLLVDLHVNNKRQGPGSDETVRKILSILNIDKNSELEMADIGCGTGASSIEILKNTNFKITAVDFLPEFLEKLDAVAIEQGFDNRIKTVEADMGNLPFQDEQFDLIWSEGAIYNIGFKKGVAEWKRFLKKNGYMVLTEITWLKNDTPEEIKNHWNTEYPEIDFAENKKKILRDGGFELIDYSVLPENCWIDEYYTPLENGFDNFLERNSNSEDARKIVEENKREIELYKKYKDCFSYGVYVAKKV
jgi:ubiquinone/menaquinone biosynthesis C-methylase UbiE